MAVQRSLDVLSGGAVRKSTIIVHRWGALAVKRAEAPTSASDKRFFLRMSLSPVLGGHAFDVLTAKLDGCPRKSYEGYGPQGPLLLFFGFLSWHQSN